MVHPESRKSPISNNETCSLRKAAFVKLIKGQLASTYVTQRTVLIEMHFEGKSNKRLTIFSTMHAAKAAV